jgi:PAS domain S-box-containing protein
MTGRRILVVDDERIVAQDIMEVITHMGCEVAGTALSGPEAIEKAGLLRPDLILMDITLQGQMDGVEAATIIRDRFDIACVFLTAYSDSSYLERAKLTQPAGYMVKPFEEGGLRSTVEIALYKVDLERALKESNEWLQTTLMSIGDGVIATSNTGRVQFMNPLAEKMTGWTSQEAVGAWIEDVFPIANENTGERVANPALESLRTGHVVNLAKGTVLVQRDGTAIPIDDSGAPIRNNKGEIIGSVLVFRDTTEARRAEREVKRHQERLEELVQERTGELTQTNHRLVKEIDDRIRAEEEIRQRANSENLLSGISTAFLRAKPSEVNPTIEFVLQRIGAFLQADRCYLLKANPDAQSFSCSHEWCENNVAPLKAYFTKVPNSALPLVSNPNSGGRNFVVAQISDTPDASLNPQLAQARQARSLLMIQLMEAEICIGFLGIDVCKTNRNWRNEEASLLAMVSDPLISALRRQRIEDEKSLLQGQLNQSQKMEAVGKLSSGIAHDFNNMLLPIIGYADMVLARCAPGDENIADLKEIRRAAEQAATLTRQLLAFSRKQVVKKSIFDVNQALNSMSGMLRRIIGEDIRMSMNLAPDLLAIQADAGQLEQIVMNLCVNARDAMPGGGNITITTRNVDGTQEAVPLCNGQRGQGQFICISLSDSGCGIPQEIADRVFEPFFTTKGTEGTGLGLSVIYGILQEHEGGISLQTAPGQGTTFSIYFQGLHANLPKPDTIAIAGVTAAPTEKPFKGKGQRVLLVEDEEAVNRLVRTALTQNGYLVTSANCVRDAQEKFTGQQGDFDMVFSDAVLPDGNGVDLISEFKHRNPRLRVLLSSGYTDKHHLMDMAKQQEISFLPKPYSLPRLFQTVAEVMEDQHSHMLI